MKAAVLPSLAGRFSCKLSLHPYSEAAILKEVVLGRKSKGIMLSFGLGVSQTWYEAGPGLAHPEATRQGEAM